MGRVEPSLERVTFIGGGTVVLRSWSVVSSLKSQSIGRPPKRVGCLHSLGAPRRSELFPARGAPKKRADQHQDQGNALPCGTAVELLSTFPNGVILYTLDGSAPTFSSTLYSGPFTVSRSVALRVVAWDQDFGRFWEADPIRFERASLFALRTISPGGGAISRSPAASAYAPNTVVTLTAVPAQGWTFLHWLGDVAGTNPVAVLTVGRDQEVIGVFGTTLSFSAQGGGRVDAYPLGELFPFGSRVRLTPVPDPGNAFAFWGNAVHGTEQPVVLSVTNASVRVACAFTPLPQGQVFLAVPVSGFGHVEISPAGSRHPMGDPVTLTAFPDQDEEFLGWAGDLITNDNPLRVTLNKSLTVRARFSARPRLLARGFAAPNTGEPLLFHLTGEPGGLYRIDRAEELPPLWRFSHWITNTFGQSEWRETWNAAAGPRLFRAVPAP